MTSHESGSPEIRGAVLADRAWIVPLSARLHDFGPPPWRSRDQMDHVVAEALNAALAASRPDILVLVAEGQAAMPLGFVYVHEATDFFTGETHGHISDLVVVPLAERRGVGRRLVAAAEGWARERGHRLITLNVFYDNHRARRLYEHLGFLTDTVKMVKVL